MRLSDLNAMGLQEEKTETETTIRTEKKKKTKE